MRGKLLALMILSTVFNFVTLIVSLHFSVAGLQWAYYNGCLEKTNAVSADDFMMCHNKAVDVIKGKSNDNKS